MDQITEEQNRNSSILMWKSNINDYIKEKRFQDAFRLFIQILTQLDNNERDHFIRYYDGKIECENNRYVLK